jgi:hypothetical protein
LINNIVVGTTPAIRVCQMKEDQYVDLVIQNLSGNNIYVGETDSVSVASGIKVPANSQYSDDKVETNLYVIADGAASDVRVDFTYRTRGLA